ncbi:MAG: hypothetical protein NC080_07475 [Paraprevotella sp.]|nr:hypothetical protein [Paraprevotella sp.]
MKKLYLFARNGVFSGVIEGDDGDLFESVTSTFIEPPPKEEGCLLMFDKARRVWENKKDYRKRTFYWVDANGEIQSQYIHPITGCGEQPKPGAVEDLNELLNAGYSLASGVE